MRWKEPVETVRGRERFWNQPRITIPAVLAGIALSAFVCSLLAAVGSRLFTGSWHLPLSALAAVVGGLVGLAESFRQRIRIRPQAVELLSDQIFIRDSQQRHIRYNQLRGYSLVHATVGGTIHRLLMLYPLTGRAFSIGIPDTVTDEQLCGHFRDRVPFVTIIDDEVLSCP